MVKAITNVEGREVKKEDDGRVVGLPRGRGRRGGQSARVAPRLGGRRSQVAGHDDAPREAAAGHQGPRRGRGRRPRPGDGGAPEIQDGEGVLRGGGVRDPLDARDAARYPDARVRPPRARADDYFQERLYASAATWGTYVPKLTFVLGGSGDGESELAHLRCPIFSTV